MKQGMTIQDAAKEIMRQSQAKADYLVNTANLHMETCDGIPILRLLDESGVDRVEPLDILPTAHRQMGDYLGIPRKYYDRMPGAGAAHDPHHRRPGQGVSQQPLPAH